MICAFPVWTFRLIIYFSKSGAVIASDIFSVIALDFGNIFSYIQTGIGSIIENIQSAFS